MKQFGSMKTTSTHIAILKNTFPVIFHSKTVCCIINNSQIIFLGNSLYFFNMTRVSKNVRSKNSSSFISNGSFYFTLVYSQVFRVYIHKNRSAILPNNSRSSGYITKRGGNHFALFSK